MPKQHINYPTIRQHVNDVGRLVALTPSEELPPGPQVTIHWDGPSGNLQLSMEFEIEVLRETLRLHDAGERLDEGAGTSRLRIYTETLERPDMQRLVKYGRTARDDVYGADA